MNDLVEAGEAVVVSLGFWEKRGLESLKDRSFWEGEVAVMVVVGGSLKEKEMALRVAELEEAAIGG